MELPVQLITHAARKGTKDNKPWSIHTADVLFQSKDRDGNVQEVVAEVRLPDSAPLMLDRGPYILDVEPYKAREGGMAFAVRSIRPVRAAAK